ncbi:LysR family transcriptional regulator [Ramlibacter sp. G-1-2-2]|uniref:LysR family transcriptional regulator n=1 Tax=Ramlibacter agri TaxID=2728837 RepID=A0A848H9Y6_9BURK|nr:LysR family transcriptional regulator [Ramlibacter agri]NML47595.1 LysR family transcriptional regulator [Ramlibacter agri]
MPTWRPDLLSLRLFVAACEEASMARAAEREAIVPSAISKRIAEMEEATGVPLLVRGARGVRPTPAGTALLHHAQQIVRSAEKMQAEIAEFAQGVRGHVRLLANISSIVEFLPRDMSAFMVAHPQIRIDLQERVSAQIAEGVREGQAELGICLASVDLSELTVHPYAVDHLGVVVHTAHPLAARESVRFEDTLEFDFVALSPDSATTRRLSALAARLGRTINHRMYVSTFEAACHIIAENLAIGVLAHDAVKPFQPALGLQVVRLEDDWARREIVLVHRDESLLTPPARALARHLQERVAARGRR